MYHYINLNANRREPLLVKVEINDFMGKIRRFLHIGDIRNFLCHWFDEEFWLAFFGAAVMFFFLTMLQYAIFSLGKLPEAPAFLGTGINILLFAVVFISLASLLHFQDLFLYKGTTEKGKVCVISALVAVLGLYTYVIYQTPLWWGVMAICLLMLIISLKLLERMGADTTLIGITIGVTLIYIVGTYLAQCFAGIEPTVSAVEMVILVAITLLVWFKHCFE